MRENPFFRSRISQDAKHIIDVGTRAGGWLISQRVSTIRWSQLTQARANGVANRFPDITVHGVDLFPPPSGWVAANCRFEIDDVTKPWQCDHKSALVYLRCMIGAMSRKEWKKVYREAYNSLDPGSWIEHVDVVLPVHSLASNPLPNDASLYHFRSIIDEAAANAGNASYIALFMKEEIEEAEFVNVAETQFKWPIGD